jgi:hypothetical protein
MSSEEAKRRISAYQSYLKDLYDQGLLMKGRGLSTIEASKRLDMTAHKGDFPSTPSPEDFKGDMPIDAVRQRASHRS